MFLKLLLLAVCLPVCLTAQVNAPRGENAAPLLPFKGQLQLESQHSTNPGNDYLLQPPDFLRLRAALQFNAWGVPLEAGGLLTTEQSPFRQAVNQGYLRVDVAALQQRLYQRLKASIESDSLKMLQYAQPLQSKAPSTKALFQHRPVLESYRSQLLSGKGLDNFPPAQRPKADSLLDALQTNAKHQEQLTRKIDSLQAKATTAGHLSAITPLKDSLGMAQEQGRQQTLSLNNISQQVPEAVDWPVDMPSATDSLNARKGELQTRIHKLKQLQNDPNLISNPDQLDSLGLLTKQEKDLLVVRKLQIGTAFPYYSELSFNGASVLGFDLELAPGKWHFQASGAHNQNASQSIQLNSVNSLFANRLPALYTRSMIAASLGKGKQEETHLHVNLLYGADSKGQPADTFFLANTPRQNYVLGIDFARPLLDSLLFIEGEAHKSLTALDANRYRANSAELGNWLGALYGYNDSLSKDFAIQLLLHWRPTEAYIVTAGHKTIGPGYISFGVPFLRNDLQAYWLEATRAYERMHLRLRAKAGHETTNLRGTKAFDLTTTHLNAGFTWSPPKKPVFSLDYILALQQTGRPQSDTTLADASFHLINLTATHSFGKKHPQHFTLQLARQIRTAQQTFTDPNAVNFPTISSYTSTIVYRCAFKKLLFTTSGNVVWERDTRVLSMPTEDFVLPPQRIYAGQASLAYTPLRKLTIESGCTLAHDEFIGTRLSPYGALSLTLHKAIACRGTVSFNQLQQHHMPTESFWQANTTIGYAF